MELIKCGTLVTPKLQNIPAIITAINIRSDKISYELSYFYQGLYQNCWLTEDEFNIENIEKQTVGFK